LTGIFDSVEFGGSKQKVLNAVFTTLVDAYIDRFIIAANHSDQLKLKLFEKASDLDPLNFTLIGLACSKKDSLVEPVDLLASVSDGQQFQKVHERIDRDIE